MKFPRIAVEDLQDGDIVKINPRSDVNWTVRATDLGDLYLGSDFVIRNLRKNMRLFLVDRTKEDADA